MGKNKGKGGKSFRSGKKDRTDTRRALVYKETYAEEEAADGSPQVCYAVATKLLGDCRVEVECDDGATRKAEIRGSLRNKQFIKPGDFVLVAIREYQTDRADIFHKYTSEDVAQLKKERRLRPPLVEDEGDDEDHAGGGRAAGGRAEEEDEAVDDVNVDDI